MNRQLSLPGLAADAPPTDGLFFAAFPDADAAERIARVVRHLRNEHRIAAKPIATTRFHVTLYRLGEYDCLPEGVVAAAREAAATAKASPSDIAFDRFGSFSMGSGRYALVLRGHDELADLRAFRQTLGLAMAKAGLGRHVTQGFEPHMTLFYGNRPIAERSIEPLGWRASEFALVHSLLGKTGRVALGRWPLSG